MKARGGRVIGLNRGRRGALSQDAGGTSPGGGLSHHRPCVVSGGCERVSIGR